MDTPDYSGVPVVALESLRIRLSQLVLTLNELHAQVQVADLPAWPSVHKQFDVALKQLEYLVSNFETFGPALQKAVIYPLPNFPHKTQGWLLNTMLRKKNLPEVDEWVQKGIVAGSEIDPKSDEAFSEFAIKAAKEHIQLRTAEQPFDPPKPSAGWSLEKAISFMNGQET